MNKVTLTIIHAYDVHVDVIKEATPYARNGTAYFTTKPHKNIIWIENLEQELRKDVQYYKDRYENILNGMNYWKGKFYNKLAEGK